MGGLDADAWRNIVSRVGVADLARLACASRLLRALATDEGAGRAQRLTMIEYCPPAPPLGPCYLRILSNPFWFPPWFAC